MWGDELMWIIIKFYNIIIKSTNVDKRGGRGVRRFLYTSFNCSAVCSTAPATPGLTNSIHSLPLKEFLGYYNVCRTALPTMGFVNTDIGEEISTILKIFKIYGNVGLGLENG